MEAEATMEITVYKRHSAACAHQDDRSYKKCHCRMMFEWSSNGQRFRISAKTRSWTEAEQRARAMERAHHEKLVGEQPTSVEPVTLDQAIALFQAKKSSKHKETRRKYSYTLDRLKDFAARNGRFYLADIAESDLQRFQSEWTLQSNYAKRNEQERLRAFFRFCCSSAEIRLAHNPTAQLEHFDVSDREPTPPFTEQEFNRILETIAHCDFTPEAAQRLRALILVMRHAGLSIQDAAILERSSVQPARARRKQFYRVVIRRSKTRTGVNNPIPKAIGDELLHVANGNQRYVFWSGNGEPASVTKHWHARFKVLFDKTGIPQAHPHRFRDTFAVSLLEKGVPIREVSRALGHKSVTITERHYAKWTPEQQQRMDEYILGTWKKR